jgi:triosephosphate isomerase
VRKMLIAGNWKMNKLRNEASDLVGEIVGGVHRHDEVDVAVCPPFVYLDMAVSVCRGSGVDVGAQNLYYENEGAYTGEVSPPMLKELGCRYVIVGHSERRNLFGETDRIVNKKLRASYSAGLVPILCVGESLEQRESGRAFDVLRGQITYGFEGIDDECIASTVIAYEPVWAIGTGKSASAAQAEEAHAYIRERVNDFTRGVIAESIRILYGGSVKTGNALDLLRQENIDGALIGGASLSAASFCEIVRIAEALK